MDNTACVDTHAVHVETSPKFFDLFQQLLNAATTIYLAAQESLGGSIVTQWRPKEVEIIISALGGLKLNDEGRAVHWRGVWPEDASLVEVEEEPERRASEQERLESSLETVQ